MIGPPIMPSVMASSAGKIFDYFSEDTEEKYEYNKKNFRKRLIEHCWLDINIEYRFNSQGFRSREFNVNEEKFLAIGCSFTFGEALNEYQLYHSIVSDFLRMPCYNLGIPGASNMALFRMAEYWIPELKPKFVILQTTSPARFEIIHSDNTVETCLPATLKNQTDDIKGFSRCWWSCDKNSHYDTMRNEYAIQHICFQNDIPCYVVGFDKFIPQIDVARDLLHPGYKTHQRVARELLEKIK